MFIKNKSNKKGKVWQVQLIIHIRPKIIHLISIVIPLNILQRIINSTNNMQNIWINWKIRVTSSNGEKNTFAVSFSSFMIVRMYQTSIIIGDTNIMNPWNQCDICKAHLIEVRWITFNQYWMWNGIHHISHRTTMGTNHNRIRWENLYLLLERKTTQICMKNFYSL